MQVGEGRAYAAAVRAAELALALAERAPLHIQFEKDEAYAPWRHLLTGAQQLALRALGVMPTGVSNAFVTLIQHVSSLAHVDTKKRADVMQTATAQMPQVQRLLCRSGGSIIARPPRGAWLLVVDRPEAVNLAQTSFYERAFIFDPYGAKTDERVVTLPVAVQKHFFAEAHAGPAGSICVIGSHDTHDNVRFVAMLRDAGAQQIILFDAYHFAHEYAVAPAAEVIGAGDRAARRAAYQQAGAVVCVGAPTRIDNHFFWEAVAQGLTPLAAYLPAADTFWTPELLSRSWTALQSGAAPLTTTPTVVDWSAILTLLAQPAPERRVHVETHAYTVGASHMRHFQHVEAAAAAAVGSDARAVALVLPGPKAKWSARLNTVLRRYKKLYVDTSENPLFHVDVVGALFHLELEVMTDSLTMLQKEMQQTPAVHIDVIHVHDSSGRIQHQSDVLTGLAARHAKSSAHSATRTPSVVVCRAKKYELARGGSGHRIGAGVAIDSLQEGIVHDASGRFNLLWLTRHAATAERGRFYLPPYHGLHGLDHDELDYPSLPSLLRHNQIDLFCSFDPMLSTHLASRALWAKRPIPVVGMLHSIHATRLGTEVMIEQVHGALQPFDALISPTHCGATAYRKLYEDMAAWLAFRLRQDAPPPPRFEVIPYGIETAQYKDLNRISCRQALQLDEQAVILLCVGRFSRDEKADLLPLLLALRTLSDRGHRVQLALVGGAAVADDEGDGTDDYAAVVQSMAQELQLQRQVHISRDATLYDKILYYGAADIFVAPSDNIQETFGLTLLEAMAAALPVVASEWDGYREIVRHGETGFLVPTVWTQVPHELEQMQAVAATWSGYGHRDLHQTVVMDNVALLTHLEALILNPELRRSLGAQGRVICDLEYDQIKQSRAMGNLFLQLINEAQAHSFKPAPMPFADAVSERFGHYARHLLTGDMQVTLGPHATPAARQQQVLQLMNLPPRDEQTLVQALVHAVATAVTQNTQMTVTHLLAAVQPAFPKLTPDAVALRLLRCAKYGLLTVR